MKSSPSVMIEEIEAEQEVNNESNLPELESNNHKEQPTPG